MYNICIIFGLCILGSQVLCMNVSTKLISKQDNFKGVKFHNTDLNDQHRDDTYGSTFQEDFDQIAMCQCGEHEECQEGENSTEICTCIYGYARDNGTCKACDCAPGMNCTFGEFYGYTKICDCPYGYENYKGSCAECNCGMPEANCSVSYGGSWMACSCPEGYEEVRERSLGHRSSCKDIDECVREERPCDDPNAKCFNTPGSYICNCRRGYLLRKADVEKNNACLADSNAWKNTAIVIIFLFCVTVIGLAVAIYSRRKFYCPNGRQYMFRSCEEIPLQ